MTNGVRLYRAAGQKATGAGLTKQNLPQNNSRPIVRRELLVREFLTGIVLSIVLMGLALILPAEYTLNEPETPGAAIKAPWLIAWLQVLLRHFRPGIAAFFIPLAIVAIAASLPWLPGGGRSDLSERYRFRLHQAMVFAIASALAFLTFWGL